MFEKDPRTFSQEYKNLSPEQKAMVKLEITITRFFKDFDRSISRWERLIYPMMLVFGLLGFSGFYLIYNMTSDMHIVSTNMDPDMQNNLAQMSKNMEALSQNISTMTVYIGTIVEKIERMDSNITQMNDNINHMKDSMAYMSTHISGMDQAIAEMNQAIHGMTYNTGVMTRDVGMMNRTVSRPANFFNSFAPW